MAVANADGWNPAASVPVSQGSWLMAKPCSPAMWLAVAD